MPYYIKPTFGFTANSNKIAAASDPGPSHFSLSLSTKPTADTNGRLTVDLMETETFTTSTTQQRILDGFVLGGATKTVGDVGCFVYLKNNATAATDHIMVAIISNSRIHVAVADDQTTISGTSNPLAPHVDTEGATLTALEDGAGVAFDGGASTGDSRLTVTNGQTLRTMTLKAGEFAFFPFDYTGDIYVQAAENTPQLEYWRFDRG